MINSEEVMAAALHPTIYTQKRRRSFVFIVSYSFVDDYNDDDYSDQVADDASSVLVSAERRLRSCPLQE